MWKNLSERFSNSVFESIIFLGKKKNVNRKILVMGDRSIGKTSLLHVFSSGYFPQVYEPTVFENHTVDVLVGHQLVQLSVWDTVAYQELEKSSEPSCSYFGVHVIMLCFSVDKPISLTNTENQWLDEIIKHCPGVKICLVALKCDLRDNSETRVGLQENRLMPVDYEQGLATARRIRASRYLECSARQNRGVTEAFLEAAKVSINSKSPASLPNLATKDELQETRNPSLCSCLIN